MKLKERHWFYKEPAPTFTVEQAASIALQSDRDGSIERAHEMADKAGEMLARLIAELNDAGTLSDDATIRVIGARFVRAA